ncbi:MAG: NAD-dependent alcohol dehydrogenase [Candidatus Heimdallarchaeota archaeon LC_2]|nr:MAG: NAD-dependent alcohol dehydrogenase [Candidatus Heimdallarchaeota archaeon LC_2]
MKAIIYQKYGSPDVLLLKEVDTPIPENDEVKVKIVSASLNATDFEIVGGVLFVRISSGLRKPSNQRLGCDFAGRVESIGKNVTEFKPGDEVYADLMYQPRSYGAFAEYVCIPEKSLRMKPASMTFEEASTIPQAGVLALQGIKGKLPPQPGQKVLINGAGGGVGTFAIQIAKYYGTEVTAVDSADKFDMMLSLGADHVIDYTQEDFTKNKKQYDLILDVIARRGVFAYRRALAPKGSYRMVGGSTRRIFQVLILGSIISRFSSKKVGILMGRPNNKEDMEFLVELFEDKKVVPVIDKIYSLNQAIEALRYLEDGKAIGKIVITME